MAQNIIKGDDLMLFDPNGHSIGYATSHVLTLSGETQDISSKDHGQWNATNVAKVSWEITSENLYTDDGFDQLFTYMTNMTAVTVFFGHHAPLGTGVLPPADTTETTYWTKASTAPLPLTGKAFITSLSVNANTGENATFSCTLTGAGSLTRVTA